MTISAVAVAPALAGVSILVVAGILLGVGLWLRTRPDRATPPPYVPYPAYAPYPAYPYAPGPASGGFPGPPQPRPGVGWSSGYSVAPLHTIHVHVENATPSDESVQILVNGIPMMTLPVPAGKAADMSVHPNVAVPPGASVRVEAVTAAGMRATQDVIGDASGNAVVSLRIG